MSAIHHEPHPQLAAIVYEPGIDADRVLRQAIDTLRPRGIRFGGIIQSTGKRWSACRRVLQVEDLATGTLLQISQDLGSQAESCILDTSALSAASKFVRTAINEQVDVLVTNRFGEQEANGQGLRAEFADAAMAGFIIVTVMKSCYLDAWTEFGGEFGVTLEPTTKAVSDWIVRATAHKLVFA